MKNLMILPLVMALSASAFAQDANPTVPQDFKPTTITKTKITCSADRVEKILSNSQEDQQEMVTKGKASESIRTTWASGDTEYRFSEYTGFADDGEVRSKGRSMTKFVTKTEGNQVTETSEARSVTQFLLKDIVLEGGNLQQRDMVSTAVYEVNGNERTLISAIDDGKLTPTNGAKELHIKLSDTKKVIQYTEKTPYTWEDGDFKVEVLKSEMNCLFETIK